VATPPEARRNTFAWVAVAWAGVVLAAGLLFTQWWVTRNESELHEAAERRFQSQVQRVEADIQQHFDAILGPLRGARGLWVSNPGLTARQFADYISANELAIEFPGLRGIGVVQRLPRRDLSAFQARERIAGRPGFTVHGNGTGDEALVLKYIEPLSLNSPALGLDLSGDPRRRAAAEVAMREGVPAITPALTLPQDTDQQVAFVYFLPVYASARVPATEEERLRTARGLVTAPLVLADIMTDVVANMRVGSLQLFSGEPERQNLLFDSAYTRGRAPADAPLDDLRGHLLSVTRPILLGRQVLQMRVASADVFERTAGLHLPGQQALGGAVVSVLAALIVWLLLSARARALSMAQAMSDDLRSSEALLRGSIETINEAYVLYDPQDRLVYCNQKYRDLYGQSADLIVPGASFESIIRGGAERGQYVQAIGRVDEWVAERLATHRAGTLMHEQRLDSGRWLRVMEQKMPDGHTVGFRVDITELKLANDLALAANQQLEAQQARLQSILEGTDVGTWEWNVQTGVCAFGERWASMLGYTLEELRPWDLTVWERFVQRDDLERCKFLLNEHFDGRTTMYEAEVDMAHKDGHWIRVLTRGKVATHTTDGKPLQMAGTHMDITKRHAAEAALAQTSATLQNVLDSAVEVGVVVTDLKRVIRVFNRGAENLLGYRASEVVDAGASGKLFDTAQLTALREELELRTGRAASPDDVFWELVNNKERTEWTLVRKDGSRFAAKLVFSPMLGMHGELSGFLGIVYDITRQKESEDSLRRAMQLAEQSSVAKSQFLANMSHEIRTPMNAILGMLQLLDQTPLTARQRDYTHKTEGAAKSLLALLNDILDFSKVEAGKMQLDPQPFSVDQLLADLSVILSANLADKPVDLVFDVDPAIPDILFADALRLKQVLINLAGNAVKFTERGQVVIRWSKVAQREGHMTLELAVQDTGIGIAPENQERIFQAFTQAEASTTRRFGGTGLGLVICTRLVRLMGSELKLQSEPGRGTTFSFSVEFPVPAQPMPGAMLHPTDAAPLHVLLVDDNTSALASNARMLEGMGWDVTAAASGAQAVEITAERQRCGRALFDALFVDWHMPQMDGWETLRSLMRVYGDAPAPLRFLLSGQSRAALLTRTVREQELLTGLLVKPLTAMMFVDAVAQAQDPAHDDAAMQRLSGGEALALAGMRVLVVEDNTINQQVAQELLQSQGAVVQIAGDGQAGLDALAAAPAPFDAVLMDLQMPVMDGLSATRALRRNPAWQALPVIAMTANAMPSDREDCIAAGMNDHIGKPFDMQDLVLCLIRHTGWKAVAATGPAAAPAAGPPPAASGVAGWPTQVNVATALQRLGGNTALLARSLRAFVGDWPGMHARVRSLQVAGRWADLQRELHAHKGLAATLGVPTLQALALQAERCTAAVNIDGGFDALIDAMVQMHDALGPVLLQVADRLAPPQTADASPGHASASSALNEATRALLGSLREKLLVSDMHAMELHASLPDELRTGLGTRLDALDAAMADLDFAHAAAACDALLQAC